MTSVLVTLILLLQGGAIAPPPQSINEVLGRVSKNVRDFESLLPNFVCNETISSTAFEYGKLQQTRTVNSIFTALQKPSPAPRNGLLAFTETRDIVAIDGKPVRKGTGMPNLPLALFGGFSAILSMTFSPENLDAHKYVLERVMDDGKLVVNFATKDDQRKLRTFLDGEDLVSKDTGTAWIDPESMQIVRLQRDFFNLPRALKRLRNTVDYGPVSIGDGLFWMPQTMRTDATDRDPKKTKTFLAEYTNCKKFIADIKIVP